MNNTMTEEWKLIEDGANYEISTHGNVRNKITNKILKSILLGSYLSISLIMNNRKVISKIHRLVATRFLICTDETYVVNHIDGNKINNRLDNLEWVSRSENTKHAFRLGLTKGKKMKVSQYTLDGVFIREYDSPMDVEKETGIFQTQIAGVCRGNQGRKTAGGYIWKYSDGYTATQPIPDGKILSDYKNYIITNDGKVYNLQRKRYLISTKIDTGYMTLTLIRDDKKKQNFSIHRLVALVFLDNPNNCPEVNHIDFDKTNNNVANLEWVSRSDNIKHNYSKVDRLPV